MHMSESFVSIVEKYTSNKNSQVRMNISDLVSIIKFNSIVDSIIDTKGIVDAPMVETKYTVFISDAMQSLEQKFSEFGLKLVQKPTVRASSKSLYLRAQMKVWMKSDPSVTVYVPLYYTHDNWKLLEKENVESELVTVISSSIVHALADTNCTFINPRNYDKFPAYNVEVEDYVYDQWNIVLEIMTGKVDADIKLYYVWNAETGDYKRTDENSELALKHNKYTNFMKQMK